MKYDVFFSISQTPVDGHTPDEATMLRNFFEQVQVADQEGYGIAWLAQAHLSTEIQKRNKNQLSRIGRVRSVCVRTFFNLHIASLHRRKILK